MCTLTTNAWMIQVQSLKLTVSPHLEKKYLLSDNGISLCEGNVWHKDLIFENRYDQNFNRVTINKNDDI